MLATTAVSAEEVPAVFIVTGDVQLRNDMELLTVRAGWGMRAFSDARAFLAQEPEKTAACLLLDMDLLESSRLDLLAHAGGRREIPVICVATNASVRTTVRAMKAGAVEFLPKPLDEVALLEAIRQALRRSRAALAEAAKARLLHASYGLLSRREREVMERVVAGRMNKQVAIDLGISEITVKAHRGKVMRKMKAASLPDLVNMAAALGIGMSRADRVRPGANLNLPESVRKALGA